MLDLLNEVNDLLWGYCLIAALVGCGLWFTWRTRFVQFRMVPEMLRLLTDSSVKPQGIQGPTFRRSQLPELEHDLACWE